MRYYWYGWHPNQWYGYDPIPRQENSYYTYNYYDTPASQTSGVLSPALNIVENELPAPPQHQTPADQRFSEAVIAFEDGKYAIAANLFRQAMMLDREDIIMPFAYAQALFADKEYLLAVLALRNALTHINPNENSIYYPRGLYKQEDDLYRQIDELMIACDKMPYDRNLKLLLGYHLLGVGETEAAAEYLQEASRTPQNAEGASVLLALIQQVRDAEKQVQMKEVKP
jgi:thioredoxin-like negative regulator of GroEL